jgi:hypothetical protein
VSPARFERTLPTSSRWCLLPLDYEDVEPPPGVEPGLPPYGGGAAGRARRRSWPSWSRTRKLRVQSPAGLPIPLMAIECGRCDSNAHAARFELARSSRLPSLPHGAPREFRNPDRLIKSQLLCL